MEAAKLHSAAGLRACVHVGTRCLECFELGEVEARQHAGA